MEQQILTENTELLEVSSNSKTLVSISEPVQTELLSLDSQVEVKEIHEESAVLLVLTEGGSLYKKAVSEGYSGTELEWLTEVLDSKASVQFVVTTMANGYQAYASLLVDLEASVASTYASNTKLSEVLAQRDVARALEYQSLTAKIDSDIQATNTTLMDVIVTRDMALSQSISNLTAKFDLAEARITNTEQAISTETEARTLAVTSLNSAFQDRITSEISLVNTTIANANSATATQIANLSTSFNGLLSSNITTVNESISTETSARASQIEVLRTDFTNGISAVMEQIQEVRIDIDGNTQAIDSLTSTVTNPTSGLSATFTRANQAWTLADNTAGALSVIEGKVNHATTGLAATYAFAQQVLIDANNNTASAINNLRNEITAPDAGWTANNTFIQSIKNTADNTVQTTTSLQNQITSINNNLNGNIDTRIASNTLIQDIIQDVGGNTTAISGLNTSISNINGDITDLENWKTNTATVQLTAHTDRLGNLESKAFIGVSSTVGGKATIAGLTINSVDYSLRFQGDIFELTNTSGVQQLYYDSSSNQWKFNGGLLIGGYPINSVSDIRGLDAKTLRLSSTAQAFKYNSSGALESASSIVFTATSSNLTGSPVFATTPAVTLSGTGNTRTLSASAFGANTSVKVTVTMDGLTDEITVVRLNDGINGENALSAYLTNESHTVTTNSDGSGGLYGTAGGQIKVFSGVTAVTTGVTYSVTNVTSGLSISINSSGVYTVTGCTVDNAVATIRAVVSGVTIDKVYSLSKSKQGSTGAAGEKGKTFSAAQFFNFKNNSTDGFTFSGLTPTPTATHLNISGFNSDPQLIRNCDVNGSLYPLVVIRMRNNTGSAINSNWQIFYSTNIHGYSESFTKVQLVNLPADGQWYDVIFDMSMLTVGGNDYITSAIRNIRIDPPPNGGYSIDIESIFLGKEGAAIDGKLGAGFYGGVYSSIDWTTNTANNRFFDLIGRMPTKYDIFTQSRSDNTDSQSRQYNGSSWDPAALQVNGSIIALGTIAGNKIISGTEITSPIVTGGRLRTAVSGSRTEIHDDGTYLIWAGDGAKTDANGTFWIKKNGDGYVKGTFFQGQLMRRRNNKANLSSVTVTDHITAGKPVRIDCTGYFRYQFSSATEVSNNAGTIAWSVKRNGVVIESGTRQMNRAKIDPGGEPGINWQNIDYVQMTIMVFDDSPGTAGQNNSYTFEMTDYGYGTYSTTIATDENLVG